MLSDVDQGAVIKGLRRGSRDAWAALYDGYSTDVWRYIARLIGPDTASVADIVQETFLAAARSARNFDSERGSLWCWLTGIAHHQLMLYWRQAARVARLNVIVEAHSHEFHRWLETAEPVDEIWERDELSVLVRAVLAHLPAEYSTLLTAKYLDERSLEQLSHDQGCSTDAVKSKLARARREFRARFELTAKQYVPQVIDRNVPPIPETQLNRP